MGIYPPAFKAIGFEKKELNMEKVIVVGANGAIGKAFADGCEARGISVVRLSREDMDLSSEDSIKACALRLQSEGFFDAIFVATGILHTPTIQPEKNIKQLNQDNLHTLFQVNAIGPIMVLKHFSGFFDPQKRGVFAAISAHVGSISDNKLGGWYGYRSSKTALNMFLKTASIELRRTHKELIVASIHPGTVDTPLSRPFHANIPKEKLLTPEAAAHQLIELLEKLTPQDSGNFLNWDGSKIEF
jgi:NAD(P)-dependent dehydrogenase (short-subunit alcohol dehydrogenase family)